MTACFAIVCAFRQALIQGFPLVGVKKAHTLPHQTRVIIVAL